MKMMNGNPFAQDIRHGFFPDVLAETEQHFDIIALNCVFEHVPDIDGMIDTFKRYLEPHGSVMLNVPVSSGFMFKVSRVLHALRVRYPFDRIWQKGFVSPHLHYFASQNIAPLFSRHQMRLVLRSRPVAVQPRRNRCAPESRSGHPVRTANVGAGLSVPLLPAVTARSGCPSVRVRGAPSVSLACLVICAQDASRAIRPRRGSSGDSVRPDRRAGARAVLTIS